MDINRYLENLEGSLSCAEETLTMVAWNLSGQFEENENAFSCMQIIFGVSDYLKRLIEEIDSVKL